MTANRESVAGDLILAVDAGGTKTAACLATTDATAAHFVLGRGRSIGGNPLSVGIEMATRAISEAVQLARRDADRQSAVIAQAVLSIAGAAGSEMRSRIRHWAHEVELAARVAIVPDMLPVLAAGTPNCCGVAVISGTGSVAFGRAPDGRTTLAGGWGYMLGDDGSGYAIGRAALRHALGDLEANAEIHPLARALLESLGATSVAEVTAAIYRSRDPRSAVASLAPLVTRAAEEGVALAVAIVNLAAVDLARLAARAASSLDLAGDRFALAAAGGVLVGSKRLRDQFEIELRNANVACDVRLVTDPIEGCLRLAQPQFAGQLVQWD